MSKDKEELQEIAHDILREVYNEAEPGLDFDNVLENPGEYDAGWWNNHYISKEKHNEIFDWHIEQHDLTRREERAIYRMATLNLDRSKSDSSSPRYVSSEWSFLPCKNRKT